MRTRYTHSIAAIFQTTPTFLLPRFEHTWHSHTSIPGCVLSGRQSACCTAHNSYHPIHPPSTAVPLTTLTPPPSPASDSKLSCSAPCNPLGGDSYYFHFSNSVGGREASVQHTPSPPFYFLAIFSPTLRTVSIALLLAPPSQVAGRRKNIYIYLFLRVLRLPTLLSSPRHTPFSPQYHPPPPPFEILSVSLTFFFFLIPLTSFSFLPSSTTSYRVAAPRVRETTERERVEETYERQRG